MGILETGAQWFPILEKWSETRVTMGFATDFLVGNHKYLSVSTSGNPVYRSTCSFLCKGNLCKGCSFHVVYLGDLEISMWFLLRLQLETWISAWFPYVSIRYLGFP